MKTNGRELTADLTPKFWRNEVSGRLEGPITRLVNDQGLSVDDILLIRAYLRQWIDSPAWDKNPAIDAEYRRILAELRTLARQISNRRDIEEWLAIAVEFGIDPL